MTNWVSDLLVCPEDHSELSTTGSSLTCRHGHCFPTYRGVPILIPRNARPTYDWNIPEYSSKDCCRELDWVPTKEQPVHPDVQILVAETNGILYKPLIGALREYPIPNIRVPSPTGMKTLLDIGCNWGRWSIAARRRGYRVIGVDPNLRAVMTAKSVCRQLGLDIEYVCADARELPFRNAAFDTIFSYSVIQHFSKEDARSTLREVARTLGPNGSSMIQMANALGVRSTYHRIRQRFRPQGSFDVRYWHPTELCATFEQIIGPTKMSADGFGGLGVQPDDLRLMPYRYRPILFGSKVLQHISLRSQWLLNHADSLYFKSVRL